MIGPKLQALKKKIVGKVSDVLSAPKRKYFGIQQANADTDTDIIKTARDLKGLPKYEAGKGATDALKYQTVSDAIKRKRTK